MTITEKIASAIIPDVLSPFGKRITDKAGWVGARDAIRDLLQREEYGYIPAPPKSISVEELSSNERFAAGKAVLKHYKLTADTDSGEVSFNFASVLPKTSGKIPLFVHINFRPEIPDSYQPTEEIIDRGYGVFSIHYEAVTTDNGDFDNGIAKVLVKDREDPHATGKIALWSWAIMRVIDYIETQNYYDPERLAVIGHSRLGKTTLLTAAFDERVKFACANNSGNSGDAISRITKGEKIADIVKNFPFWFCPAYARYVNNENSLPFDQHFLLALTAPRTLLIGSASLDGWADPASEYISLTLTNSVYALYGMKGLVHGEDIPEAKSVLQDGDTSYHVRHGLHYLSREDWNIYMDFIDKKTK